MKMRKVHMKKIVCFIVCFSFVIGLFIPVSNIGKLYAASVKLEQALQWAITIANDDSHGYSQSNRWGNPDYDCSSFVISALKAAGFDVGGATYTQNMRSELTTRGFTWIPWSQIGSAANLRRGDILLNNSSITSRQHTEFYLGNNQNVGAHGPKGYPAPGDQTGNEISVSGYYDHPWTGVLRYKDDPLSISTVQVSLDSSSNEFRTGSDIPFQWTWGGAGATGYDLYIAKRIAGTVQYDWDNANRIYFAGNAVMSGVAGASLFKQGGEFAAYMRARNTSNGQYGGQSNFVYFVVKKGKAQWKIWISRTKMGSETEVVPVGKACYLCYQIIDKDTQKNWDVLYKSNYKVKESIAKPNGAIAHSYTYTNDNNWIAITPEETGEYKGIVDISGDFTGKLECSFMVKNFYYGDINNDGDITVTDLSMVNQAVNNPQILTADQRKRADVNADGAITKEDVTWIQQYVLGVIQEFPAESHVHNYSSKITKKATCSSTGVRTYSCICGESYTVTLPKTSHTPATDPAVEATCTRDGKTQGSHCSVCGTILTAQKTVKATGHVHTEVRNAKTATCLTEGYSGDRYCKDCGRKISSGAKISKSGHKAKVDPAVPATCTRNGKTQGSHCSVCGTILTAQKTVKATGHVHTEVRNAKTATCLTEGYSGDRYCKDCGRKISSGAKISKSGHKAKVDPAVPATCTRNGKTQGSHCSVCGTILTAQKTVKATGHVHTEVRNAKTATCLTEGYSGDRYCKDCGRKISSGAKISKSGHKAKVDPAVSATCTRNGKTQGSHCSVCGTIMIAQKTVKATGHMHTEVRNARAATTLSYGYTGDIYCKDCGVRLSVGQVIEKIQSEIGEGAGDSHEKYLEPGDMLYDASGKAEYEVIKVTGNTVYVSYNAVINKKQKVITVPNQIRTKEGIRCKVTAVSEGAFYNAKEVKQIVLDSQITKIGARAFNGCKKLTSLTIKSGKITSKTLSGNAFKGVSSKTKVKVPKAKKSSYKKLFYKKGLSKKVKFINM